MALTIDLPPALENDVRQQAARRGQKVNDFVVHAFQSQLAQARTGAATDEATTRVSRRTK